MKLAHLLPFMDKEEIKELALKIINQEVKGIRLAMLYPFLDREDLDSIVEDLIQKGSHKDIYAAMPFLSKTSLNAIYDRVKAGELEGFKEQALLPFLGKDKLKEMFDHYVKQAHNQASDEDNVDVEDLFEDDDK